MAETLDQAMRRVLELVAQGRLSAEEAAPILDALSKSSSAGSARARTEPARDTGRAGSHPAAATRPNAKSAVAVAEVVTDAGDTVIGDDGFDALTVQPAV